MYRNLLTKAIGNKIGTVLSCDSYCNDLSNGNQNMNIVNNASDGPKELYLFV